MNKGILIGMSIAVLTAIGCGNVIIDWSGTGGPGGEGGSLSTSTETTSSSGGTGGSTTSSTSETTSSSTTDTLSTITSTTTDTCEAGTFLCMEACCDKPLKPTVCYSNESGYCCPDLFVCIPKT